MNEMSIRYRRDEDICYWYFLFQEFDEMQIKPQYFREKFEIEERKFWNELRLYRPPNQSPAIIDKFLKYYREFIEGCMTIREFTSTNKIRMSTFDMWRRYFMTQERIEQLENDGKLIKPKSLMYMR